MLIVNEVLGLMGCDYVLTFIMIRLFFETGVLGVVSSIFLFLFFRFEGMRN